MLGQRLEPWEFAVSLVQVLDERVAHHCVQCHRWMLSKIAIEDRPTPRNARPLFTFIYRGLLRLNSPKVPKIYSRGVRGEKRKGARSSKSSGHEHELFLRPAVREKSKAGKEAMAFVGALEH